MSGLYSNDPNELWEKILGKSMHYHNGGDDAVRQLYDYIPTGSSILDCGCGWGGPAKLLIKERSCKVTGITNTKTQAKYITDFDVICKDLHDINLSENFDIAMFIESYTHLYDSPKVLSNIKDNVNSIIIRDFSSSNLEIVDDWGMIIRTKDIFIEELTRAGFEVKHYSENPHSLKLMREGATYWYNNMKDVPDEYISDHMKLLRNLKLHFDNVSEKFDIKMCLVYATKK